MNEDINIILLAMENSIEQNTRLYKTTSTKTVGKPGALFHE